MHLGEIQKFRNLNFSPLSKDQPRSLFFKTQIKQVKISKWCQIPLNMPWQSLETSLHHLTWFWHGFTSGLDLVTLPPLWHDNSLYTAPNRSTSTHKRQSSFGRANLVQWSCPNTRRSSTYECLNSGRSKEPRVRSLAWPAERGLAAAARAPRVVALPLASAPRLRL
jgi:hypothetical protein